MSMLDRRLQVLVDDAMWERLEREAKDRKVSVGTVVREAIDDRYQGSRETRRAAIEAILAAEPVPVPEDPADLKAEIEAARAERFA
jgi:hypothetical protein